MTGLKISQWLSPSERKWFGRGARLAAVIAVLFAATNAWQRFEYWNKIQSDNLKTKLIYECMSRLTQSQLDAHKTVYGTIDAQAAGCSYDRPSWVSLDEIKQLRAGELDFDYGLRPFNITASIADALVALVISLAGLLTSFAVYKVAKWVW